MEEILNQIWQFAGTILGSVTLGGIFSAIFYGVLKGAFSKTVNKIDYEGIAEKATEKGIDKIKEVSFKQTIQPIAESELKKITEQANEYIDKALKETNENYNKLVDVIESLASYFDNSIGVPEEKIKELHESIEKAKTPIVKPIEIKYEEVKEEKENEPTNTEKSSQNKIVR